MNPNKQQKQASDDLLKAVTGYVKKGLRKDERFRSDLFRKMIAFGMSSLTVYYWYDGKRKLSPRSVEKVREFFTSEGITI